MNYTHSDEENCLMRNRKHLLNKNSSSSNYNNYAYRSNTISLLQKSVFRNSLSSYSKSFNKNL